MYVGENIITISHFSFFYYWLYKFLEKNIDSLCKLLLGDLIKWGAREVASRKQGLHLSLLCPDPGERPSVGHNRKILLWVPLQHGHVSSQQLCEAAVNGGVYDILEAHLFCLVLELVPVTKFLGEEWSFGRKRNCSLQKSKVSSNNSVTSDLLFSFTEKNFRMKEIVKQNCFIKRNLERDRVISQQ